MSGVYQVGEILPPFVDPAFALVREQLPEIGIDAWRSFCASAAAEPGPGETAILIATAANGYVHGVAICTVVPDFAYGALLDVSVFVVASAADEPGVAADLVEGLAGRARHGRCGALRIRTEGDDGWISQLGDAAIFRYGHVLLPIDRSVSPPSSP